jgi:magnesium-protoporphyrin O-methyltransferase
VSQCQCQGIESVFDQRLAATQLERVRRRGALKTTRFLIEALRAQGVQDKTLLDIGGGVGTVHHELLAAGAKEATDVDASSAYVRTAKSEAERRGLSGRVRYLYGNFLDLATEIPPADIVTLDRVICCFDDMQGLVAASAEKARLLYGIVYPRDAWWTRLGIRLMNLSRRLRGDQFRVFAHDTEAVESVLHSRGLARTYHREAGLWQVALFSRDGAAA